ncbi:phosphotransferase [Paenibacillus sp. FSL R7-0345]|uniref:phosphotransferase n=1 Tax=Paenibacillus sp. FSL R7-0345 TaxID=2954535 RepID=UPI00315AA99A
MLRKGRKLTETIVNQTWPEWGGNLEKRSGGWNNTTYIVSGSSRRAILRIYDTHRDREKIEFEHAVLLELDKLPLPFATPLPVQTVNGDTLVQLGERDGKFACLFRYIEGDSPGDEDTGYYESFGVAAGLLSSVLAEITPGPQPVYRPYYELRQAYPLCTDETVRELCLNPPEPLAELSEELNRLYQAYIDIADSLKKLETLPHQLVHGDLNASNLLVDKDDHSRVAALLDFEFCTYDLRAMDPAVILSGLLGHPEQQRAVRDFCRGFSRSVRLTDDELAALPTLMLLRKIDVFLHFATRYMEGTDEGSVLHEQTRLLSADLIQLSAGTADMVRILREEQDRANRG